jgi:hypothetical protein
MTGGLLQLVTSGKQDIYLTINPEITFFKKVFRRHTNFSIELKEIYAERNVNYGEILSFNIAKQGDALHRCYLEIELPVLQFSDKYITNLNYITKKATDLNNINQNITKYTLLYSNLKGFCDIEINLYRKLKLYLQTDNISLNTIKDLVTKFNYNNKKTKDLYKNKINSIIFNDIDISGYILNLSLLLTNDLLQSSLQSNLQSNSLQSNNLQSNNYIKISEIITKLDNYYNNMVINLDYYNLKINYYNNLYSKKNSEYIINFNFANYLGHNYFSNFNFEIDGLELQKYDNDFLHINQMHTIKEEYMPNYNNLIGNISSLNTFDNTQKGGNKILVPLIFWFNKDAGTALPLVAMQYPSINMNVKINDIIKIINFENYTKMYNDLLIVEESFETTGVILNNKLIYKDYTIDTRSKIIKYNCILINDELLSIKYPDLTINEKNIILTNNGSEYTLNDITKLLHPEYSDEYIINLNGIDGLNKIYCIDSKQYNYLMSNIKNQLYSNFAYKFGSYYPYVDFNLFYSSINIPKIKLIGEYIYYDDVERAQFANSKLEYIIEMFDHDTYNISNQNMFNCELSFSNPTKELLWYIQPQIFADSITNYGQNMSLNFSSSILFENQIINNQSLIFNKYQVLPVDFDNIYYQYTLSYKYLNNILVDGIYYQSFSLFPEDSQPSGCVNLREIKAKQYSVMFNPKFLSEYFNSLLNPFKKGIIIKFFTKYYDMFIVEKGQAKILFNL